MTNEKKKLVIVTGGTRGIGRAIMQTLEKEGYNVLFTGRESCEPSVPAAMRFIDKILVVDAPPHLDLSSADSINAFVTMVIDGFGSGSVYALVNNAGVCETCPVDSDVPGRYMDVWKRVIDVNLTGTAHLTHELIARGAFRHDGARIVNIASQLGKVGRAEYGAYCASKFGLIGWTETLSRELARSGFTANAVCPSWVESDMLRKDLARLAEETFMTPEEYTSDLHSALDLGRFTEAKEVADLVAFLLSDKAKAITGQAISLNGPER